MTRSSTATLCALLLALGIGVPGTASACSCVPPAPVDEARDRSTLVFVGTVDDIVPARNASPQGWLRATFGWFLDLFATKPPTVHDANLLHVTFDVARTFKGPAAERLRVATHRDGATCGYGFERGETYLVYAGGRADSPSVSLCSRTAPAAEADGDLAILLEQ